MCSSRLTRTVCIVAAAFIGTDWVAAAQEPVPTVPVPQQAVAPSTLSGQVRQSGSLKPVARATIIVEGTTLEAISDADGRFSIANVPQGTHHIVVAAPGFLPLRVEVTVGATAPAPLEMVVNTEVHY